jgi:4-hydroxy-3-polyprenylbenzoate decarboxylase
MMKKTHKYKHLIIGITGASGVIYGLKTLQLLKEINDVKTHLIISKPAVDNIEIETDFSKNDFIELADFVYENDDFTAPIASGSFLTSGMIVAPCSVRTISAINVGNTDNLITRAADVCLKERRPLVLMFRETPFHKGHIKTMLSVSDMGAIVMPPSPSFYTKPKSIDDIVTQTSGRAIDLLGINSDIKRWGE